MASSAYASRENHDSSGASVRSAGPSSAQRGPTILVPSAYKASNASAPSIAGTSSSPVLPPADQPSAMSAGRKLRKFEKRRWFATVKPADWLR